MLPVAIIRSPLAIYFPRKTMADKKYILNLNNYRNTMYIVLNQAKQIYTAKIAEQLRALSPQTTMRCRYILYPKTKRLTDIHNVCCIHEKFFMDAVIKMGILPDDNYLYYKETSYTFGKVDKDNYRVDIEIYK